MITSGGAEPLLASQRTTSSTASLSPHFVPFASVTPAGNSILLLLHFTPSVLKNTLNVALTPAADESNGWMCMMPPVAVASASCVWMPCGSS